MDRHAVGGQNNRKQTNLVRFVMESILEFQRQVNWETRHDNGDNRYL